MALRSRFFVRAALLTAAFSACPVAVATAAAAEPRLKYDSQCVTLDGRDMVIFSGAFHYFRCPKALWADRFRKLKEAGFNTVETYAAWNWHEQTPPENPDDYSKLDMTDLQDWLTMATDQFGLQVVLRPGPYICAEWDGGGYPQWLLNKRPAEFKKKEWYRSDDPVYLAWCKHWYAAVAKIAVPLQVTRRPAGKAGIILWQIENEYDYSDQPVEVKKNQLVFLAHASRDLGIDVPLTTCLTNNKAFRADPYLHANVVQSDNTYPGFNVGNMDRDTRIGTQQTDKFRMITELQGGWFAQVGGKLSEAQGYDETHLNHVTMFAWQKGFTATNYYMGFGGTNFGDWGSQGLTTTYDYDAPVRECGGVTARYFAAKALGEFIADHGAQLARATDTPFDIIQSDDKQVHLGLKTARDGSRFLFVRSDDRNVNRTGKLRLKVGDSMIETDYQLGSFGANVLFIPADNSVNVWYPKPQEQPKRPSDLPDPIVLSEFRSQADTGPSEWKPFDPAKTLAESGIFDRQYVLYRATVPASVGTSAQLLLTAQLAGKDWMGVSVDGVIQKTDQGRVLLPKSAENKMIRVLYENAGRPNFGTGLEQASGLLNPAVVAETGKPIPLTGGWRMHVLAGKLGAEAGENVDDSAWPAANLNLEDGTVPAGKSAVYRTSIDLPAAGFAERRVLTLGRVDDEGVVYINGQQAGETHDWSQAQHIDVTSNLHPGKNSIAVYVINREGAGGLSKGASLDPVGKELPVKWEMSQALAGVAGHWAEKSFDDSKWATVAAGSEQPGAANALMTWYRMKFELPTPDTHQWVPWRLNLTAAGDGFVYLNGHQLGRYWEQGPQHDFYLPECWLSFGPGKTNVITLQLRPTSGSPSVTKAEVRPYENMAETR